MTYQVLARKWRPHTFDLLVGQTHITSALSHALETNRLHHAYLFSGTRGVGKTTIARILAKCLNCERGVSPNPCGECDACIRVDEGRYPDLIEVDAASRTKVEDTRELLDNVVYAPTIGRYKIYLIDEVHMLSGHSFNALLKTLEEPPKHVIFLFATTDPNKLPATVLSRCLQFQLRPITQTALEEQLSHILTTQQHAFDPEAISLLAQAAKGSLRDALSLLEQALGVGKGEVRRLAVEEMLGCHYAAHLPDLLKAICAQDNQSVLTLIQSMASYGVDFSSLMDAMLAAFHAWAVCQALPSQEKVMTTFAGLSAEAVALYRGQTAEQIQLYYQIALKGKQDISFAPNAKIGFEMTCLRLMHFRPFETSLALPSQPKQQALNQQSSPAPVREASSSTPKPSAPRTKQAQVSLVSEPKKQEAFVQQPTGAPDWTQIASKLQLVGLAKVLVQNCVISQWELPKVKLVLDARQSVCLNEDRKSKIEKSLSEHLKQPVDLVIQAGQVGGQSPQRQVEIKQEVRQSKAEKILSEDTDAQKLIQTFDAVVERVTLNEEDSK